MELTEVFNEWDSYAKRKKLIMRDIGFKSIEETSGLKIVAITGIRRSGKSSILMLLSQHLEKKGETARYVNLEDSRINGKKDVLEEVLKWSEGKGFLLLDEIASVEGWEGWLARAHEMLKGELRIVVSSSRSSILRPGKALRGRILPIEIYPLSFREFLGFRGINEEGTVVGKGRLERAFAEYIKYGGFPETVLAKEELDKVRITSSYFKDIMGLDIAEISGEEVGMVDEFGRYVVQTPYFSASKCLNFFKSAGHKIGKEKLLLLERCAQEAFLFFFVPIFSHNIKDASQYPRKAYSGDSGFPYAVSGKMDMGRLYENVAYLALKRRLQGAAEICYWKDREGMETDFVVKMGKEVPEAFQVVYGMDEKVEKREVEGLVRCTKELGAKRSTILTKNISGTKTVAGVKIRLAPLFEWLLEKERPLG